MSPADERGRSESSGDGAGFMWCTTVDDAAVDRDQTPAVPTPSESGDSIGPTDTTSTGFEWCKPVSETESTVRSGTEPTLDPSLVTETRRSDTTDAAVSLLAALRRDPAYGRWRRLETERSEE